MEGLRGLRSEGKNLSREEGLVELIRRALQGGSVGSSSFRVLLGYCPVCEKAVQHTSRGELELPATDVQRVLCDAEVQDTSQEPARVSRTIPSRIRNQILARSKGTCEVPRCSNRAYLELHHDDGWLAGHDADRMFHLCDAHHRARHEGKLLLEGAWSSGVCFRLADGTLLGRAGGLPSSDERGVSHSQSCEAAEAQEPAASSCTGSRGEAPPVARPGVRGEGDDTREERATSPSPAAPPRPRLAAELASPNTDQAVVDVRKALHTLRMKPREARDLMDAVMAREPGPWTTESLLRAVLLAAPSRARVDRVA
jgi:hypothetical protein